MICDFDRIDALCAGELPDGERASVLAHMEHCPACRAYYEALAGLEGEETAPEGFAQRVMDAVRTTPQKAPRRTRRLWQSVAAMAACAALVVGLGLNSGMFSAETAPTANEAAPQRSTEADSDNAELSGYQLPESVTDDQASDLPLTVHILTDEALCAEIRVWLAQQNIPELYPNAPREAYDLTAEQVKELKGQFPLLALPEEFLQLELKRAE
jgi:hypothetical protein